MRVAVGGSAVSVAGTSVAVDDGVAVGLFVAVGAAVRVVVGVDDGGRGEAVGASVITMFVAVGCGASVSEQPARNTKPPKTKVKTPDRNLAVTVTTNLPIFTLPARC